MYIGQITTFSTSEHTCVVGSDDLAYCWGSNSDGQLGNNSTANSLVPVAVVTSGVLSGKTIKFISAGYKHTCVIASDNNAYCWGDNNRGQLGDNSTTDSSVPVAVNTSGVLSGKTILSISAGYLHTCAIASDNNAYCWGTNGGGQLGNNSNNASSVPVSVDMSGVLSGKSITSITTGYSHSCAIASDIRAYCWGYNSYGQLGNNSSTDSSVPVAVNTSGVLSGKTILSISGGHLQTCVIASDNRAYCWGYGGDGQLGRGSTANSLIPVAVSVSGVLSGKLVNSISTGRLHVCVTTSDSRAYCWGYNTSGQLGNNSTANSLIPVAVDVSGELFGKAVMSITTGYMHTCAIASDSQAYCWGSNSGGKLGNNSTASSSVPTAVTPLTPLPILLDQSVFRTYDGSSSASPGPALATTNNPGSLGMVSQSFRLRAGITNKAMSKSIQVTANGYSHSCAIASDYQAYCWGRNDSGRLGNNSTTDSLIPVAVDTTGALSGKKLHSIVAGNDHACAVSSDGQAYCWGSGDSGRLGNGSTADSLVPSAVTTSGALAGKTILSISAGFFHTCVIASDNQAYCWGNNSNGQLGNNSTTNSSVPVAVTTSGVLAGKTLRSISLGGYRSCVIASDNQAYCWGDNSNGQLGNNSTTNSSVPVAVTTSGVLAGKTLRSIANGGSHVCTIASDNQAYCWGDNTYAGLGNNSTTNSSVPVAVTTSGVLAGKTLRSIITGGYHSCVVASDNQSYCWGYGGNGQLGNNTTSSSTVPVAVSAAGVLAGKTIISVSAGTFHTCAIASDNQAYCWGSNSNGGLGNNSTTNSPVPVAVTTRGPLQDASKNVAQSSLKLRLEYRTKPTSGTCNISSGWSQVTNTSAISYDNASPNDEVGIWPIGSGDPSLPLDSTDFSYQQTVRKPNSGSYTLTNGSSSISGGQTALWDFVLKDRSATNLTDFCFRIVTDTTAAPGTSIDSYSVFPEIKTANGSLSVRFVDNSNNTITNPTINLSGALTQNSTQTVSGIFSNSSNRQIEVSNTASNTGWNLSLAATDGPSTKWSKTDLSSNYPFNSATSSNGQLVIHTSGGSFTVSGTKPNGDSCTSSGMALGSNQGFIGGSVDSITLATMGGSSSFGCIVKLRDIGLNQTIPANQPAGNYILNMTMTVVAS